LLIRQRNTSDGTLGRHTLVNAVQQLFDKARARSGAGELQGTATCELSLGGTEPAPRASAVSKHLFRKRRNTREAHRPVRFVAAQGLTSCVTMRQRAPRHDERIHFVLGHTRVEKPFDRSGGETVFDQPDEILVRAQAVNTE
jgi:hypothetical protein